MKLFGKIVLIFVLCLAAAGAAYAGSYANSTIGLQFEVPSDWTAGDQMDGEYIIVHPLDEAVWTKEGVAISISVERAMFLSVPKSVETVSEYFRQTMKSRPHTVLSEETTTFAGYPAREIVYTDSRPEVNGPIKHREIYIPKNGDLYVFRFISVENKYDTYWQEAKLVFDTLRLN